MLTDLGQHWSLLTNLGQQWSLLTDLGQHRSLLTDLGHHRSLLTDRGQHCSLLTDLGQHWYITDRSLSDLFLPRCVVFFSNCSEQRSGIRSVCKPRHTYTRSHLTANCTKISTLHTLHQQVWKTES